MADQHELGLPAPQPDLPFTAPSSRPAADQPAGTVRREVNGVALFERRLGDGLPVTVLHGGPGASHDYLRPGFDRLLAPGRQLVFYDQRGGGQSPVDRSVPCGWREHVADLEALRASWGQEQLVLCGYSWGGLLALLYALEHPDRVARLVLVSPAPSWRAARDEFERRFAEKNLAPGLQAQREALRASDLRTRDPARFAQAIFELSVVPYFFRPALARELTPFRVVGRVQQEVWQSLGMYDLRDRLPSLRHIPSHVLHGEDDVIPIESARSTASLLGAGFTAVPHCGHCPFVEAPELFAAALDPLLPRARAR
jgi:proline iminopeptidase